MSYSAKLGLLYAMAPNLPIYTGNPANDAKEVERVAKITADRAQLARDDAAKAWPAGGQIAKDFAGDPIGTTSGQVFWWLLSKSAAGVLGVVSKYEMWVAQSMQVEANLAGIKPDANPIKLVKQHLP